VHQLSCSSSWFFLRLLSKHPDSVTVRSQPELIPWSRVLLEKLIVPQLVKKLPKVCNTVHKSRPPVPPLSQINPVHAPNRLLDVKFSITISDCVFQVVLFPQASPLKPVCTSILSHTCNMPRPFPLYHSAIILPYDAILYNINTASILH
jgi:hypothetical protein